MSEELKQEGNGSQKAVPLASLGTADVFEPTIEESILASGLHIQNAWEPAESE
jgi:hypothetical protein